MVGQQVLARAGSEGTESFEEGQRLHEYAMRTVLEATLEFVEHLAAMQQRSYRLKIIRELLKQPATSTQLEFFEEHPLIRDPAVYGALVTAPDRLSDRNHDKKKEQDNA